MNFIPVQSVAIITELINDFLKIATAALSQERLVVQNVDYEDATPTGNHQSHLPRFGCSDRNGVPQDKVAGLHCKWLVVRKDDRTDLCLCCWFLAQNYGEISPLKQECRC